MEIPVEIHSQEWQLWRSCVYLSLARLYRQEPDQEVLQAISEQRGLACLFEEMNSVLPIVAEMESDISANAYEAGAYQEQLSEDYNRLFTGPGPLVAPPWESVYRSKERLIFGEQTLAVRAFYHSFGLKATKQAQEPEDHIALEFEFLGWLCQQAAKASSPLEAQPFLTGQRDFFAGHVLEWVPVFCEDVRQGSETVFYRSLAQLTVAWLAIENKAAHIGKNA